jgi:hypothetical protein
VTRRSEQLDRIEALVRRLEETVAAHAARLREQAAAIRIELSHTRASAESAHAGVQALADMLPVPSPGDQAISAAAPQPPSTVQPAAGGGMPGETAAVRRTPDPKAKGM